MSDANLRPRILDPFTVPEEEKGPPVRIGYLIISSTLHHLRETFEVEHPVQLPGSMDQTEYYRMHREAAFLHENKAFWKNLPAVLKPRTEICETIRKKKEQFAEQLALLQAHPLLRNMPNQMYAEPWMKKLFLFHAHSSLAAWNEFCEEGISSQEIKNSIRNGIELCIAQ